MAANHAPKHYRAEDVEAFEEETAEEESPESQTRPAGAESTPATPTPETPTPETPTPEMEDEYAQGSSVDSTVEVDFAPELETAAEVRTVPVPGRDAPEALSIVTQKPEPVVRPYVPGARRSEQHRPRRAPVEHPRTQRSSSELAARPRTQRTTAEAGKRQSSRLLPIALLVAAIVILFGLIGSWSFVRMQHTAQESSHNRASDATEGDGDATKAVSGTSASDAAPEEVAPLSEFEQKVQSGEYRSIRLIGDSITAGYATDGYVDPDIVVESDAIYDDGEGEVHYETTSEAQCWANDFRAWAEQHNMANFVNAGISGWFMQNLADNPEAWIREGADVIVVALGTNDAGYYGSEQFEQAARTALEAVEQNCKQVIVIAPVDDLRPDDMVVQPASEFGDILKGICEERGYTFVDPRVAVTSNLFDPDGLHPNTQGSHAIWDCIKLSLGLS